MPSHPLFFAGAAVATVGFVLFAGLMFSNGGVNKAHQFRVIGELFSGKHGAGARALTAVSLLAMASGSCLLFGGVAAGDNERADRCTARCEAEGYTASRMGPNSERTDDRSTWWVACICEGGGGPRLELRADAL